MKTHLERDEDDDNEDDLVLGKEINSKTEKFT
jgi:hypothetical protein